MSADDGTSSSSSSSSSSSCLILGIESTPNPSSFLIRLSRPLAGLKFLEGSLKGNTYSATAPNLAPEEICSILQIEGLDSVYAMATLLTINKKGSASWESVLPLVLKSLLGETEESSEQLRELLLPGLLLASPSGTNDENAQTTTTGQVRMRIQFSNKIPIQIEGTGSLGTVQRLKLASKFQDSMAELQQDDTIDFFAGRMWIDRGTRYYLPNDDDTDSDSDSQDGNSLESFIYSSSTKKEKEILELQFVLQNEAKEVDDAYSPERLSRIIAESRLGSKDKDDAHPPPPKATTSHLELTLEDVDRLCDLAENNDFEALDVLVDFVSSNEGLLAARRNALAYLGGTAAAGNDNDNPDENYSATTPMRDRVFNAVASALENEKSPIMRRTAGDALSDLGDARAIGYARTALGEDRSKLVQWRAARILGELASTPEIAAFLKQQAMDASGNKNGAGSGGSSSKYAFEVAFEIKDALRKVQARLSQQSDTNNDGSPPVVSNTGPIWKQIQERGG